MESGNKIQKSDIKKYFGDSNYTVVHGTLKECKM